MWRASSSVDRITERMLWVETRRASCRIQDGSTVRWALQLEQSFLSGRWSLAIDHNDVRGGCA